MSWEPMPKIPRWNREVIITEKIDGTNASIIVSDDGLSLQAASRTRVLTPDVPDNHGFRAWVEHYASDLLRLGPGTHFGEWWGAGINKRYVTAKRAFSLFNTSRWTPPPPPCLVVPVLWTGLASEIPHGITVARETLREHSVADPDCKRPEGIVIFHVAAGVPFKITFDGDGPKSASLDKSK